MHRRLPALVAALLAAAVPAVALGAGWTPAVSPGTATQGQATTFTVTATNNAAQPIGCLEVDLPASFVILSLGNPTSNSVGVWDSNRVGNIVVVDVAGGGFNLEIDQWVRFTITASPTAAGSFAWANRAYTSDQATPRCKGGNPNPGPPLQITVTPTATPTPAPTSAPTATPTGTTTPTPSPTQVQNATPTPESTPGAARTASPDPQSTSTAGAASSSPQESESARPSLPPPGESGSGGNTLRLAQSGDSDGGLLQDLGAGLDMLALLDGPLVWVVPGAAVLGPGLLVILFVALQAIGALAWIPAVRHLGGDDQRRRPTSRPA